MHTNRTVSPAPGVGESSSPAAVDLRRLPWMRRLPLDYAYDFPLVAPFFSGDPADRASWRDAIDRTRSYTRRYSELAAILAAQQERREAPPAARAAAQRLSDPRTVAIVTGQQAGLFGGPLFTLLKAITAMKLAEHVARDHQVPVVALFWIDAEDHDWDEVRSCTAFDETLTPRTVALSGRADDSAPVATVRLNGSIEPTIDALEAILPATDFRAALIADLRRAYVLGRGMADAFGRWLEQVLGERGLIVYDASDPAAKPLAATIFQRELLAPGETARLAAVAGSDLSARGYHSQVQAHGDTLALFHLDGARRAIRQQHGRFVIGDTTYPAATLLREALERPASFSPNVLLRPIVQDATFPTACYVAGPNELAYLAQLRQVYDHFGVPMPLMYPRATATLLDAAALRFLTKSAVPLEALRPQDDAALNELLEAQIPPAVERAFGEASQAVERHMSRLVAAVPGLDPTLEGAARSTLSHMQHDLETLHGKMIQAAKRRDETLRRQFARTRALAFPAGQAQERAIGFVSFLNQYGPALVDRLVQELPLDLGRHWIIAV